MKLCPDREQLELLLDNRLVDTARAEVERHVEGCADCQQTLEELTGARECGPVRRTEVLNPFAGTPSTSMSGRVGAIKEHQTPPETQVRRTSVADTDISFLFGVGSEIGRYRVIRLLDQGGFGQVYPAHDNDLDRTVAIKVTSPDRIAGPEAALAYLGEARALARLDHPHIVPIHDVGRTDHGLCYIVSKYIEGTDLRDRLRHARPTLRESIELVAVIAEALHHAHSRDLVHRDIKPANILIDSSGKPWLADFGLALKDEDYGKGPSVVGTPIYMSPEQARGEGHRVDGRSDIFSLGVVFYELLTGRRPFRGDSHREILERIVAAEPRPPRQVDDTIPRELERICQKAISKRASERYNTAGDMAEDLRSFLEAEAANVSGAANLAPRSAPPGSNHQTAPLAAASGASDSNLTPIRIIPKGLRSFDQHDADFFLALLPGARDRNGLPESIRFWKTRIETTGTEGIGLAFLEETFSASTAPPEHRFHQKAAQAVLKALLPETGTDIKGQMRSRQELLEASGYANRPRDFDDLIHILDPELRLITPTDPEGSSGEGQTTTHPEERYYQFTHDYLVHSLRDWLTRKQRETRRGRAELRLAERSSLWKAKPENRRLPSVLEWANIRLLTKRRDWTEHERRMMRKAGWIHGSRMVGAVFLVGLLGWGSIEGYGSLRASSLVEALRTASTTDVPVLVRQLDAYRRWANPRLKTLVQNADFSSREKLHGSLALLPVDASQVDYLYSRLIEADPGDLPVLRDALKIHRATLTPRLWTVLESANPGDLSLLLAASALADYDAASPRWESLGGKVMQALIRVNPVFLGPWLDALRPARTPITTSVAAIFRNAANLLMDADPKAYSACLAVAQYHEEVTVPHFQAEIARTLAHVE